MIGVLRSAFGFPRLALRHHELLRSFVWRELAARYEGSLLGRLWPIIYPLVLLAIYHFVFAQLLGLKMGGHRPIAGEGWETTFFMLSGILPWIFFSESVAACTPVVLENANIIKKIAFPSQLLPSFVVIVTLFHFLIALVLFAALFAVVSVVGVAVYEAPSLPQVGVVLLHLHALPALLGKLLWLPLVVLLQVIFTLGLGMLVSTLNVFVRDLRQVVPLLLLLWMFVTPIFYDLRLVESAVADGKADPWVLSLMQWNPILHLLELYRGVFSASPNVPFPIPACLIFTAISVVTFVVGHAAFVACKGHFADEV